MLVWHALRAPCATSSQIGSEAPPFGLLHACCAASTSCCWADKSAQTQQIRASLSFREASQSCDKLALLTQASLRPSFPFQIEFTMCWCRVGIKVSVRILSQFARICCCWPLKSLQIVLVAHRLARIAYN